MDIELHEINVTLSKYQKEKISKAFNNCETITLRLGHDALRGSDTLIVPSRTLKSIKNDAILDKSTFIERFENGTLYENSTTDERFLNYWLLFQPTFVERLERKRNTDYEGMAIHLDYSLMTDLIKDSIAHNVEKLI